ncbi:MAG: c-type cytochrome [Pseudomonadota bacterium]
MDNHENMSDSKTSLILAVVVGVLVVIAIGAAIIANIADSAITHERSQQDIENTQARIEPVGDVNLASNPNPELGEVTVASADTDSGESAAFSVESAYNNSCASCHAAGVMDSPVLGDVAAWSDRIAKGKQTLYDNAINGIGSMPAKGGSSLSDDEVKQVVDYMVAESQ